MRHIAVIGAGPSGLYLVDQLLRAAPDVEIDVLERLPTPLGLVRYGVAPDHQSTKGVGRLLDRILSRERVRFWGNVTVGSDIDLEVLLEHYDTVVLATGASRDRRLGIPGEHLPGVYGSGEFIGWYNSHPDAESVRQLGVRNAVIVGAGNVAIDVARMLAKTGEEFDGSDLAPEVEAHLTALPVERITIVARSAAAEARFTQLELAELGAIARARTSVADPDGIAGEGPVADTLRKLAAPQDADAQVAIDFRFGLTPAAVLGEGRAEALQVRDRAGKLIEIPADLIVTCIGYQSTDCSTLAVEDGTFPNEGGKVSDRVYAVGWCKRGPSGTIPTNRTEASELAQRIAKEALEGGRQGAEGLRHVLSNAGTQVVDYGGWRRIDEHEVARATERRVRHKHADVKGMIKTAGGATIGKP